eukprot:1126278-Alexandrium_andersonii.AAC.1
MRHAGRCAARFRVRSSGNTPFFDACGHRGRDRARARAAQQAAHRAGQAHPEGGPRLGQGHLARQVG